MQNNSVVKLWLEADAVAVMQKLENRKKTNAERSEGQKEGAQRTQREQREEERAQVKSSEVE